jgi:hypothetical protein
MEIRIGDYYIRNSDGKVCKIRRIFHRKIVLESEDGTWLTITDDRGLEKAYKKKESKVAS